MEFIVSFVNDNLNLIIYVFPCNVNTSDISIAHLHTNLPIDGVSYQSITSGRIEMVKGVWLQYLGFRPIYGCLAASKHR